MEEFSMKVYKEDPIGTTNMLSISTTFRNHRDASAGDDCSLIRFFYDAQMQYAIAENDETPPIELILLPLSNDDRRGEFLATVRKNANDLANSNANGNGVSLFSTSLSSIGPVVTTQNDLRTRSPTIAPTISVSPTAAPTISPMPTAQPSASPTRSQMPSSAPIISPSSLPSLSPSAFPSSAPSTEFNYIKVDFYFHISYPPSKQKQVEVNLLGNMTMAFEKRFRKSSSGVLSDFHNDPLVALDFDESSAPIVQKIAGAREDKCRQGNAIATEFNVCERFIVIMGFQHRRKRISSGALLVHYVRSMSESIAKELKISYDGDDSVKADLLLVVSNVDAIPQDVDAFCDGFKEELQKEFDNYNITEVLCNGFEFEAYDRRGLRKLQEKDLGELIVDYTIIAEYKAIDGNSDIFGTLVEDSINADGGKKVVSSLEKRGLLSGTDVSAVTRKVEPTQALTRSVPTEEIGSQSGLGATGIAVIIVSACVVCIAGFFFYKAMQKIKVINEDPFYDYDLEGTTKAVKVYPELYQDTSDEEPEIKMHTDEQANTGVAVVKTAVISNPNQQVRSMPREGVDRQESLARLNAFESRLRQRAESQRSSKYDQEIMHADSNSSLESFEQRLRKKAGESSSNARPADTRSSLDNFEERLRQKKESNKLNRSDSNSSLESFDKRLRKKAGESSSNLRPADSRSSLDNFEERLRQKKESNKLNRSDSNSSLESFEQRLRRKAETNSNRTRTESNSSLESFEDRLKRKASEGNDHTSGRMQQRVERSDSNTSLDAFQRRIAAKSTSNQRHQSATS
eukprot:scaffold4708_cov116-Skeletonema_marinoi.AAC.1